MEQVFLIVAILVYWLFRGVLGGQGQRRSPGAGTDGLPGPGPRDPRSLAEDQGEAQERALEALRRWEERQRARARTQAGTEVGPREGGPAARPARAPSRPAARPSAFPGRIEGAGRTRQEAFDAIARLPDRRRPEAAGTAPPSEALDEVSRPWARPAAPDRAAERKAAGRSLRPLPEPDVGDSPGGQRRRPRGTGAQRALRRIERQPLLRRAILYADIFGPPRGLP